MGSRPSVPRSRAGAAPSSSAPQAGNIHLGRFDAFAEIAATHAAGGWLHIDGAFGLWAAASPQQAHLVPGSPTRTRGPPTPTRRSTPPRHRAWLSSTRCRRADPSVRPPRAYLLEAATPDPHEMVPEMSRREVPVGQR